jgi:hypothetical protein
MSRSSPERAVIGYLVPRYSCDLFDSVLSVHEADAVDDENGGEDEHRVEVRRGRDVETTSASGIAWMLMTRDGVIDYHVRYTNVR